MDPRRSTYKAQHMAQFNNRGKGVVLLDIDKTLVFGSPPNVTYNQKLIDALKQKGMTQIFLFSSMRMSEDFDENGNPKNHDEHLSRMELIKYLQAQGLEVCGLIAQGDASPQAEFGGFYDAYQSLYNNQDPETDKKAIMTKWMTHHDESEAAKVKLAKKLLPGYTIDEDYQIINNFGPKTQMMRRLIECNPDLEECDVYLLDDAWVNLRGAALVAAFSGKKIPFHSVKVSGENNDPTRYYQERLSQRNNQSNEEKIQQSRAYQCLMTLSELQASIENANQIIKPTFADFLKVLRETQQILAKAFFEDNEPALSLNRLYRTLNESYTTFILDDTNTTIPRPTKATIAAQFKLHAAMLEPWLRLYGSEMPLTLSMEAHQKMKEFDIPPKSSKPLDLRMRAAKNHTPITPPLLSRHHKDTPSAPPEDGHEDLRPEELDKELKLEGADGSVSVSPIPEQTDDIDIDPAALDQLERDHPTRLSKIGLYIKTHPVKASLLVLFTLLGLAAFVAATVFTAGAFAGVGFAMATIAGAAANGGALAILFGTLPAFAVTAGTAGLIGAVIAGVLSYAAWTKTTFKDGWHKFVIEKQRKLSGGSNKPALPQAKSGISKSELTSSTYTKTQNALDPKKPSGVNPPKNDKLSSSQNDMRVNPPRKTAEQAASHSPKLVSQDLTNALHHGARDTVIPNETDETIESKISRANVIIEKINIKEPFDFNELIDLATDDALNADKKNIPVLKELKIVIQNTAFRDAYLGLGSIDIRPVSLMRFVQFAQMKLLSPNEGNGDANERFNQLYEFYSPIYEKLHLIKIPVELLGTDETLAATHLTIHDVFSDFLPPKNENGSHSSNTP